MYRNIYVEDEIQHHPRVDRIIGRFPDAVVIPCFRYTEIFNRKAQDFRLQKKRPALILARKHRGYIQHAPSGYGVGGDHHFYFSTMLNCLYDCRYCFLQGMYRSANHVVFVNYEDFDAALHRTARQFAKDQQVWFFSGYDCDSLALEPVVEMADYFISSVATSENVWLELRTKSTQVRSLMNRPPLLNVVTAFSFTPTEIYERLEPGVPNVEKRLAAMLKLQRHGWSVGLRFDPLIFSVDYQKHYQNLFELLFSVLDPVLIHSVSIGVFRLPKHFYKNLVRLHPDDAFIAQPFVNRNGQISYPLDIERKMKDWCYETLVQFIDSKRIHFAELAVDHALSENNRTSGTAKQCI